MSDHSADLTELRAELAQLTRRVYQLELATLPAPGRAPSTAAPARTPVTPPSRPVAPIAPRPAPLPPPAPAAAPQRRPAQPHVNVPHPRTDWSKVAENVFTARTLAWAGGVATALGIVLLFVLAAARGWVTPAMRIGLGTAVSLALVGCAVELDRRRWRADAILAAAGAGIAGLYATLWAASNLFGFVGAPGAAGLAAAIAALAVAVGIRIKQEPLAIFGVAGAMVAPVLVSREISAAAVLYASVMMAAAIVLHLRLDWLRLMGVTWLIGLAEAVILAGAPQTQVGFGPAVVAIGVVTGLIVVMLFAIELRRSLRPRITPLGWPVASSALALSLIGAAVYAGDRTLHGHSLAGITLAGLALAWALLAAVPWLPRRPHPDLTDTLAAFALAIAATSTGLLAGGPGRAVAWAAESAVLVLLAERIAHRSGTRRIRLTIAAGVYLALAVLGTLAVAAPDTEHLPSIGAGSNAGMVALVAIALAGIAYCFGTRWVAYPGRVALWAVPGIAIGYLPAWALPAEQAVVAYAALSATLFVYRRTPWLIPWLRDEAALVIATCWWLVGAILALAVTAPLSELAVPDFTGLGAGDGMAGLAALAVAASVLAWSLRRPAQPGAEYALLAPVTTLAYLVAEAVAAPHTMWAWLVMAGAAAALVHVPLVRRTLGAGPLIAAAGGLLALGTVVAWNYDGSLQALQFHGQSSGWQSITLAVGASLLLATAELDVRRRSYLLWLPYLLTAQLSAMLLPGQYPLVAMAGLAMAVSACAIAWPAPLRTRLDRTIVTEIGVIGAVGVAVIVPLAYETPAMLFQTSSAPASGLAAAIAATAALFVAAAAAGGRRGWRAFGIPVAKTLVYTAGAAALWTLAAAILGASEFVADASSPLSVHDRFQQGHVVVSIGWVLVGLALVVLSLRGDHRGLRVGGIALLFVALGKLFLYDLAYLTAMARAISFIVTGSVLLLAALLLARFAPQVKAALGDDGSESVSPRA